MHRALSALAALLLAGCGYPYTPPALPAVTAPGPAPTGAALPAEARAAVTILVSIDGFRADYLDRGLTPNLAQLGESGVRASMRPSFPSKTFPNHWTLVTGLVPDHHGIIANRMEDAARPGETFTTASDDPFWWNAAEPIWVAAERAGVRTATMFWPGANVAWGGRVGKLPAGTSRGGTRPSDWQQFNADITDTQRVDAAIDWLRRPADARPRFLTLYFDDVDETGHDFGPDSAQVNAALANVDRSIGRLRQELTALGQPANLVIVSDHGMAATSPARVVQLDRIADPADWRLLEGGPVAAIFPVPGHDARLAEALLRPHDHLQCWRKSAIPARFRYGANPRVPPFVCLAETGWLVEASASASVKAGNHGWDNAAPQMRALFIANGPAFRAGTRLPVFDNVDVYPLLRELVGLPPAPGRDGTAAPFARALVR